MQCYNIMRAQTRPRVVAVYLHSEDFSGAVGHEHVPYVHCGGRGVDLDGAGGAALAAACHSGCAYNSCLVAASRLRSSFQRHELAGVNNPGSTIVHPCCKGGNGVVAKAPQTLCSIDLHLQTYRTFCVSGHHVVTFLLLLFPLRHPAFANFTCWDGITELNTFFLIARRQWHSQRNLMHWHALETALCRAALALLCRLGVDGKALACACRAPGCTAS